MILALFTEGIFPLGNVPFLNDMKQKSLFSIVYEDDKLLGVDKSPGLSSGGISWDTSEVRLDKLFPHRIYIISPLDQDASGLVLFAKDIETHKELSLLLEKGKIQKRYIAVVHGRPVWKETSCDLPLVPDGAKHHRTIIDKYQGKKALTHFHFLGSAGNYSVIEAFPQTERNHQLRVHLASLGHPIVCDPLYGKSGAMKGVYLSSFKKGWQGDHLDERPLLSRLGLHAAGIMLPKHSWLPEQALYIEAKLPKDMAALIKQMEKVQNTVFGVMGFYSQTNQNYLTISD